MSKLKTRIILSIVISLGVILAIATTVQGASLNAAADKHSASETLTNYDGLIVTERDAYYAELDAYDDSTAKDGHDCRDKYDGPID